MTITSLDLKIMQSERMTDFPDGGGRMSATQVVDGVVNNVFADQSDLDRINGRVSLRKVFLNVDTANTDPYLGAFGFLTEPPADPNVSCLIFNTQSPTDLRAAARSYVENYRVKANKTQYVLYGNHLAGQSTVQVYCRAETPSPDIGDVWCLSVEQSGYPPHEQYVAVQEVLSRSTVTFFDGSSDFVRDVLIVRITTALGADFPGRDDPIRESTGAPTLVRATQVLDSAKYYAVLPLAEAALDGALSVSVVSPYVTIVPTTTAETPIVDQLAGLGTVAMIQSGAANSLAWSGSMSGGAGALVTRYLGTPYARRSLYVNVGATQLRDDGQGGIVAVDPSSTGWSGEADYQTGRFAIARDVGFGGSVAVTATPAGGVLEQGQSYAYAVTAANRNTSYVFQIDVPAPGTLTLDYLALGKWIRLRDNGAGALVGNAGEGSAMINYATGSIAATLGALPDVDSDIIISWGLDIRARNSSGEITTVVRHVQQLSHTDIDPSSLVMSWETGGVSKMVLSDPAGVLSGDATGYFDAVGGTVQFATTHIPDANITYDYDWSEGVHNETFTPTPSSGQVNVTLANAPAKPGSVRCNWIARYATLWGNIGVTDNPRVIYVYDNGIGGFSMTAMQNQWGVAAFTGTVVYSTGEISMSVDATLDAWYYDIEYEPNGLAKPVARIVGVIEDEVGYTFPAGAAFNVRYQEAGAVTHSVSEGFPLPPVDIFMGRGAAGPAVPGSLKFEFRGRTYVDRGGSLYYDIDPETNSGTLGGSYDYAGNMAHITAFGGGASSDVTIASLLTRYVEPGVSGVFFRAPGAPLRAGNFTVRATAYNGDLLSGTADINGVVSGDRIAGQVDWQTGICRVVFGEYVPAAGNETQPWFDPAAVVGSDVWQPLQVDPATVYFGAVVYRSIPVNPELIGIDPVRLPSDGRVAGIRAGDTIVVHETQEQSIAVPVAGATETLGGWDRLVFCEVWDAEGTPIEDVWYTLDLDNGELTWANPLNLSAYTMPVRLRYRIEDAMLCTDVQITGQIGLQRALTHDYSTAAQVSSCVTFGDLQARMTNLFDQATYSAGVWSDVVDGAEAPGTYNNVVYPITVTNDGAIDERWAIVFVNPSAVNVIGQTVGQVLTNAPIGSDVAPINPVSGEPYFTMTAAGFGSGWASQNLIRFNTVSVTAPLWIGRITKPGEATETVDHTRVEVYGNAH